MKRAALFFITAACVMLVFGNCNKTNEVSSSVLRVFNVGPAVAPQDVFLNGNGKPSITGLAYGIDTNAIAIQPGTYNIQVAPTGTTTYNTDYNIDFSTNKNYMMFLLNVNGAIQTEAFDENKLRLGYDTAEFRFLTFSPDAPVMDVSIKKTDTAAFDTTYKIYSRRVFNDVYTNRAYAGFTRITAGQYYVKLRYADSTLAFDSIRIDFIPKKTYTIYVKGYFYNNARPKFTIDRLEHN